MRDKSTRPEQLINLASIISLMKNEPNPWTDPRHEIIDWATEWILEYQQRIEAGKQLEMRLETRRLAIGAIMEGYTDS